MPYVFFSFFMYFSLYFLMGTELTVTVCLGLDSESGQIHHLLMN